MGLHLPAGAARWGIWQSQAPASLLPCAPIHRRFERDPLREKRFATVEVFPIEASSMFPGSGWRYQLEYPASAVVGAAAQHRKPCVNTSSPVPLGKKEGERRESCCRHAGLRAVALNAQLCGAAVIGKNRIARCLVQAGQKGGRSFSAPEIAVGEAVALSPSAAVGNKMIIAVSVKAVFLQKKFRDTLNAVLPVPFCPAPGRRSRFGSRS